MKESIVTTINGVKIIAIAKDGDTFVPVRHICEALGIDFAAQYNKLQVDETLSSVIAIIAITAADGKSYDTLCLPQKHVYGWLFTVSPNKVSPDARDSVIKYRRECYEALWNHFSGEVSRRNRENLQEIRILEEINRLNENICETKGEIKKKQTELARLRAERLNPQPVLDL